MSSATVVEQGWINPKATHPDQALDAAPETCRTDAHLRAADRWRHAVNLVRKHRGKHKAFGTFATFNVPDDEEGVPAVRYSYDVDTQTWRTSNEVVKYEKEPFARGALRECVRLKKLSKWIGNATWENASAYVAKRYLKRPPTREAAMELTKGDVAVQMCAKRYAEHFTRRGPPKPVDFVLAFVLEVPSTGDVFCVERYIPGTYEKFNSNSGFTETERVRNTPDAFSHFTFVESGGELMVVDIQGVGDILSDPEIHTIRGDDMGEGNLGANGMALFFHSHTCNPICRQLGLTPFERHSSEIGGSGAIPRDAGTVSRAMARSPSSAALLARRRATSKSIGGTSTPPPTATTRTAAAAAAAPRRGATGATCAEEIAAATVALENVLARLDPSVHSETATLLREAISAARRAAAGAPTEGVSPSRASSTASRTSAPSSPLFGTVDGDDPDILPPAANEGLWPSRDTALGKAHLALAGYHARGQLRPLESGNLIHDDPDAGAAAEDSARAALYHLSRAARHGSLVACMALAEMLAGRPASDAWGAGLSAHVAEDESLSVRFARVAAHMGSRAALIRVGDSLWTNGEGDGPAAIECWSRAAAIEKVDAGTCFEDSLDNWDIHERIACAHLAMGNPEEAREAYEEAANEAMAAMKGKLANRFYARMAEIDE